MFSVGRIGVALTENNGQYFFTSDTRMEQDHGLPDGIIEPRPDKTIWSRLCKKEMITQKDLAPKWEKDRTHVMGKYETSFWKLVKSLDLSPLEYNFICDVTHLIGLEPTFPWQADRLGFVYIYFFRGQDA